MSILRLAFQCHPRKEAQRKRRMSVDFIDINKACPKDDYSLPKIYQKCEKHLRCGKSVFWYYIEKFNSKNPIVQLLKSHGLSILEYFDHCVIFYIKGHSDL